MGVADGEVGRKMARPGLMRHRKFARLARLLGSEALGRGHLEILWDVGYENGDDLLGDAADVEHLARWSGESGLLAHALEESGFLDKAEDGYRIHDLYDHAPKYVQRRMQRESERRDNGVTISEQRRAAATARWKRAQIARNKMQPDATDSHLHTNGMQTDASDQKRMQTDATPAPAPNTVKNIRRAKTAGASDAPAAGQNGNGQQPQTWLTPFGDDWRERYGGELSYKQAAAALAPLVKQHTADRVRERWRNYLASTGPGFASPQKFAQTFGSWEHPQTGGRRQATGPNGLVT